MTLTNAFRKLAGLVVLTALSSIAQAGPLEELQPGHWYEVPNSRMSAVDPCPGRNCSYSGNSGQSAVIEEWNGGAFATRYGTKGALITWGGGHRGYLGNEIYAFDLGTLRWIRVTDPVVNPSCNLAEAELQDGSPCSPHNYDYVDYHPGTNSFIKLGSASDQNEGGGGSPRVHLFSFDTKQWRRGARKQTFLSGTGATSAYDASRDVFWYLSAYNIPFAKYDPNANGGAGQWTEYQRYWIDIDGNASIDAERDLYVVLEGRSAQRVFAFDLKNPNTPPVQLNTTGDRTPELSKANGFEWDPVTKQFVAWVGGSQVYTLRAPASGDWRTGQWVWSRVNAAATNTVTPTAPAGVGTYSRWRYVPGLNIFVVYNGVNDNVFFYKLSAGGGTPVTNPTVTLSASPTAVASQGSTTLTWTTTNANACSASASPANANWTGSRAVSGTATIAGLTTSTTFSLACTSSSGGSTNRSVSVTVDAPTPAPTVTLSANPTSVALNGSSTLTWTTSNASSCTATDGTGGWAGSKATSGSQSISPIAAATTFTLTCTGAGGTTARSANVSLVSPPSVSFSANPTAVASGSRTTLTWTSANASACSASGAWSGAKATSGTEQSAALSANSSFTIECSGPGGSTRQSASVTVTTTPPPPSPVPVPTVSFAANPTSVASGARTTLSWSSTNATACVASGAWSGNKAASGSEESAALTADSTFTIRCDGAGGSTSRNVGVTVTAAPPTSPPGPGPTAVPPPSVTLVSNPDTVTAGSSVTLSWTVINASSCTASDGWAGTKTMSGQEAVSVNAKTTYTLTCAGAGGTGGSSVTVSIASANPTGTSDDDGGSGTIDPLLLAALGSLLAAFRLRSRRSAVAR
jgi:hypothetical protein